ncbi:hypothetical protein F5X96DRAFT_273552 [Biscogniauxia mediterranea]|nr:hypothetical protein F5X96DRAFT_273552 [Biscogniauxia mediterranea]
MRLFWYAGTSAALATGVVTYAFNQRANFYSAMVYLSQNNLSLMILINLILLCYSSFVWGLQRLCYGPLRPVEIEQLYEKAWFAVTETCLAMTIFREEVGAWFLVMFTALVTGKVWEWIGEGRVEVLEQQPPANPRLFHTRLSISLLLSVLYDSWLFTYAVNSVIQQARPNMMVMFLFEFAILTTCSFRTAFRYLLSLVEADIVRKQTRQRLEERRRHVREQRSDIMRRRESGDPAEAEAAEQEELPNEEDIDEMDIEVPGWESKGQWVLSLDLMTDFVKLGIYSAFFAILMMFYGLPIHIMRDLFLTGRSFVKRLSALMQYRKALQDMNKYPDANQEELAREDTCIICREEMRPWDPTAVGAVERSRPKKLPCGHILHFGCLKGWLERQQVCPTCRQSVVINAAGPNREAAAPGVNIGGRPQVPGQAAPNEGGANAGQPGRGRGNMRVFQLGPIRLGFAQGNAQNIQDMADRLRMPLDAVNAHQPAPAPAPAPAPVPAPTAAPAPAPTTSFQNPSEGPLAIHSNSSVYELGQLHDTIQRMMYNIQTAQAEAQAIYGMTLEVIRRQQQQSRLLVQNGAFNQPGPTSPNMHFPPQPPLFPPMAQIPSFPNLVPRASPPAVTRHGGVSYTAAIPSGSQDLPEGVVIPPGWSLLPLQRLDGQPGQLPGGLQPTNTVHIGPRDQQQHATAPLDSDVAINGLSPVTNPPSTSAPEHLDLLHRETQNDRSEDVATSTSQVRKEPPDVAAPTPVMPNWGGAAQLFANGEGGSASSSSVPAAHEPEPEVDATTEPIAASGHLAGDEDDETSSSTSKGKAKAVTVEDAEDE